MGKIFNALSDRSYCRFNVPLAKKYGIEFSIYVTFLSSVVAEVYKKGTLKVSDGMFTVHRDCIMNSTTLSAVKQRNIDNVLSEMGIVNIDPENKDRISVNLEAIFNLIISIEDTPEVEKNIVASTKKREKASKEDKLIDYSKKIFPESLQETAKSWILTLISGRKVITEDIIRIFESRIHNYSEIAQKEILESAISNAYTDATYAIRAYDTAHRITNSVSSNAKMTGNIT